jgi:hypothetical protein
MKALAIVCRTPDESICAFYNTFLEYDVFMIMDDENYNYELLEKKYKNVTFIHIKESVCLEHNFKNSSYATIKKEVTGWDKALYFFTFVRPEYEYVWFLEDDVFIYNSGTLLNLDMKFEHYDLLSNTVYNEGKLDEWMWDSIKIPFPPPYYCGMCCASRMSRNMLVSLNTYAQKYKTLFFLEACFPTIAKYFNLRVLDSPKEFQTVTYNRSWNFPEDFNKTCIFHPVKKIELHNMIRQHTSTMPTNYIKDKCSEYKMKIITAVVNSTDFIEIQYHTLKKYFKGEYEFIVFNDAKEFDDVTNGGDLTIKKKIRETCKNLNIQCIDVANDHHTEMNMSVRHADTFNNHVLPYQLKHPDKYLLLDSDMFLIDFFDPTQYEKFECAIVLQSRNVSTYYFWPGLCYLDFTKIKNKELLDWRCGHECDSGGMMRDWLQKEIGDNQFPTPEDIRWTDLSACKFHIDNIYFIKHLWSCSWNESEITENLKRNIPLVNFITNDTRNMNDKFFCEIYDGVFLHYRAGGNWKKEGIDFHRANSLKLKNILCGV